MCLQFKLGYEFRRILAKLLARIELHRVESLGGADSPALWKTRRRTSRLMVAAGNLYLKLQRAGVEVLATQEWLRWEMAVWHAGDGAANRPGLNPSVRSNGLLVSRLPGETLSRILADDKRTIGDKLQCFGWALQSLGRLHELKADWGHGLVQTLSHGDATAENVIVAESSRSACWIDFDTRHRSSLPAVQRHADDLRALVFSSACRLPQAQYRQLNAQLLQSYGRPKVVEQFRQDLTTWHRPNTFQLAQAPLAYAAARALREILVADWVSR